MRRTIPTALLLLAAAAPARAADVTSADGIVVVEMTRAEAGRVWGAVDSGAAFAELVSPGLPAEYQAAVRLAAGSWQAFRAVFPEPIPVRVVLTAVPPAVWILPATGPTAPELVRRYTRQQDRADAVARAVVGPLDRAAAARQELLTAAGNRLLRLVEGRRPCLR